MIRSKIWRGIETKLQSIASGRYRTGGGLVAKGTPRKGSVAKGTPRKGTPFKNPLGELPTPQSSTSSRRSGRTRKPKKIHDV